MRRLAAFAAIAALTACGRPGGSPAAAPSGARSVGYVRMDDLVHKHPLYGQLAQYDRTIEAFDLTSAAPHAAASDPQTKARERDLERQLDAAANRTKQLLDDKQHHYQQQESAAIASAMQSAGSSGPSAAQIAGSINATAQQQSGAANAQAQRDFDAYRAALSKADEAQVVAAQRALADRANRTYRARADELQSRESALTLRLANEDASQRLALHTKLSSLALDDAAREDAQKQLAALDRREADIVGAQRNRDTQTLGALQAQLRAGVAADLRTQADGIHRRSLALLSQRHDALSRQTSSGSAVATTVVNGTPQHVVNPNLSPALRARIEKLHADFQQRFQADAKTTIADFNKTRDDLSRRYAVLSGVDTGARQSAGAQIVALRKKREDLYGEITAQIEREVRLIAQQRGIALVVSDVVAPAGGVDLTPDALKDIESLHE